MGEPAPPLRLRDAAEHRAGHESKERVAGEGCYGGHAQHPRHEDVAHHRETLPAGGQAGCSRIGCGRGAPLPREVGGEASGHRTPRLDDNAVRRHHVTPSATIPTISQAASFGSRHHSKDSVNTVISSTNHPPQQ